MCQGQVVAIHTRRYQAGQFVLEPQYYLKLLERKPGSLDNARPFKGEPWCPSFDLLRTELEYRYGLCGCTLSFTTLLGRPNRPDPPQKPLPNSLQMPSSSPPRSPIWFYPSASRREKPYLFLTGSGD